MCFEMIVEEKSKAPNYKSRTFYLAQRFEFIYLVTLAYEECKM